MPCDQGGRRFWPVRWDFLIGDTPELFVATLLVIGVAFGLRHDRWAAVAVVPTLAVGFLVAGAFRGRRKR